MYLFLPEYADENPQSQAAIENEKLLPQLKQASHKKRNNKTKHGREKKK